MKFDADLAIVGAGPLGIELAAALKLSGISYLLFDKGQLGQMIYNFPPQTRFFSSSERISIAGMPIETVDQEKCSREQYLAYLRSVIEHYNLKVNAFEEVLSVEKKDGYELRTTKGSYRVRFLVVATGSTSYPRLLNVPGEELPNVSTKMIEPHLYFGQKVVIVGGKNSAAESALRLHHAGSFPHLIIRKPVLDKESIKYWILPELESLIKHGKIGISLQSEVVEITSDSVIAKNLASGEKESIAANFVIKAIGFEADMRLLESLGVTMIAPTSRPFFDDGTMETNIPDLFVLGTIVGGTQKGYRVFIENSHQHVGKILRCISARMDKAVPSIDWVNKKDAVALNLEQ